MRNMAILIIVFGFLMTFLTRFDFNTTREGISAQTINTEKTPVYWSPVTGLILMGIGSVMLITTRKKVY
jgi:hypothetical protein